jgi:hypothetical protein
MWLSSKSLVVLFLFVLVFPSVSLVNVSASPTPSVQSTPYPLFSPSTIASLQYYSVPPLSSLSFTVQLRNQEPCYGAVYIYGGSGNDVNFKIVNPDGNVVRDFGRISNETFFKFYADKTGNFTFILDNGFSVFSSKEVALTKNPFSVFEYAGLAINLWVIIPLIVLLAVLVTVFVVWLRKRRKNNPNGRRKTVNVKIPDSAQLRNLSNKLLGNLFGA